MTQTPQALDLTTEEGMFQLLRERALADPDHLLNLMEVAASVANDLAGAGMTDEAFYESIMLLSVVTAKVSHAMLHMAAKAGDPEAVALLEQLEGHTGEHADAEQKPVSEDPHAACL